jgi:hypothetical protein
MRGFNIPTSTSTTLQASPLSTLAGLATGTAGFFQPKYTTDGKLISGSAPIDAFSSGLSSLGSYLGLGGSKAPSGIQEPTNENLNWLMGTGANDKSYFDDYGNVLGDGE